MLRGTLVPSQSKGPGRSPVPLSRHSPRFQPPIRILPEEARPGIFAPPN